jgi:outer membrane lipoprotein SlyB
MILVVRLVKLGLPALIGAALCGCQADYSPNTYSSEAVQQANKVETGVVVGYREVKISANGTVGTVTGAAAGGILGAQPNATGIPTALGALSGSVVGGIVGSTIEHTTGDTTGWEYIVREPNGDMVSLTQREPTPIPIGQKVLVITGKQARIVPDYAMALSPPPDASPSKDKAEKKETPPVADRTPAVALPATPVVAPSHPSDQENAAPPAAAAPPSETGTPAADELPAPATPSPTPAAAQSESSDQGNAAPPAPIAAPSSASTAPTPPPS